MNSRRHSIRLGTRATAATSAGATAATAATSAAATAATAATSVNDPPTQKSSTSPSGQSTTIGSSSKAVHFWDEVDEFNSHSLEEEDQTQSLSDEDNDEANDDKRRGQSDSPAITIATTISTSSVSSSDVQQLRDLLRIEETSEMDLRKAKARSMRDSEGMTEDMRDDVMALLDAFGLPYIVAPYEAEAQCAILEQVMTPRNNCSVYP